MKTMISTLSVMMLLTLAFSACGASSLTAATATPTASATGTPSAAVPRWGVQTKTSGCKVNGALPDAACTPGDILPKVTKSQVCTPGYASSVRNVSTSTKNQVYRMYGIRSRRPGQYEVDHLVNLSIGGSNDISNLWPQAATPKPGFHEKDKVENYLHNQVCDGAISLQQAQIEIATNWLNVYKIMPKNVSAAPSE